MSGLVSAELLRLRTVRSTPWVVGATLALAALIAAANVDASAAQQRGDLIDTLVGLAVIGVLVPAVSAASNIGNEFQRGWIATTYLSHPRRERVTTARALVYASLGLLLAGASAAVAVAVALSPLGADTGLPAAEIVQLIAGAAVGGAVLSVVGVLFGTVLRHPSPAITAVVALNLLGLLRSAGVGPYLPFDLVGAMMGATDGIPALAALGLLLGYLTAFALAVQRWALPRDVT